MLVLHLSDIHFHSPICNTTMDPDSPFRTQLVRDVRVRGSELGGVDAICVTGDIAFRGNNDEYAAALRWLAELCDACGCSFDNIYVVPGNHDVDRSVILSSASVRNVQHRIMTSESHLRERELFGQLQDGAAGTALFAPILAYNEFASQFDCQIYAPDRPWWQQDIHLDEETVLRVHGLTSTLVSGAEGRNDEAGKLYLSPLQTVMDQEDGVVNLVMCHHPPDWFIDNDEVDDDIRHRASVHLFGHKHRQRYFKDDAYVRFIAGAVNPDRSETRWCPGYNLISLTVSKGGLHRQLDVEAHLLAWQDSPPMFRPIMASQSDAVFRHQIPIHGTFSGARRNTTSSCTTTSATAETAPVSCDATDSGAPMSEPQSRNLVSRFWALAASQRRQVALCLGLIDETEMRLPEHERYSRALIRAGERGVLQQLAEEIERLEKH